MGVLKIKHTKLVIIVIITQAHFAEGIVMTDPGTPLLKNNCERLSLIKAPSWGFYCLRGKNEYR